VPTLGQAFRLEFQSPWNRNGETVQTWSVKFHTTGTGMSSQSEAETHALALADYVLGTNPPDTSLTRWIHYPVNSTVNDYLADYESGVHPGTGNAYDVSATVFQMLEVCHLWRCPAGKNAKGRTKYLFKYVHNGACGGASQTNNDTPVPYTTDYLQSLTVGGFGPNNLTTTLPDGTPPTGDWELAERLYTRQLRPGTPKPKA
jgi:hypothetical protein